MDFLMNETIYITYIPSLSISSYDGEDAIKCLEDMRKLNEWDVFPVYEGDNYSKALDVYYDKEEYVEKVIDTSFNILSEGQKKELKNLWHKHSCVMERIVREKIKLKRSIS